jgi:hypothetical protein
MIILGLTLALLLELALNLLFSLVPTLQVKEVLHLHLTISLLNHQEMLSLASQIFKLNFTIQENTKFIETSGNII